MIANTANADAFIVIQTGENEGISVLCQSEDNPYNYGNYKDARLLSDAILGSVIQEAQCENAGVTENDDKPIINWCASPTAIVEVGDLTDADEEAKLVDNEYQLELAQGIANGVDSYFTQK
jgi:N-acetylmuramoyl-L-alanine amidase